MQARHRRHRRGVIGLRRHLPVRTIEPEAVEELGLIDDYSSGDSGSGPHLRARGQIHGDRHRLEGEYHYTWWKWTVKR
ncbi:hypothetical protein Pen01_68250 [Phytomonospora endophytica]|nr:hypothetical protein Pen01_68250 [Phytomonospora endophytica]